jgi:hypothetical protein
MRALSKLFAFRALAVLFLTFALALVSSPAFGQYLSFDDLTASENSLPPEIFDGFSPTTEDFAFVHTWSGHYDLDPYDPDSLEIREKTGWARVFASPYRAPVPRNPLGGSINFDAFGSAGGKSAEAIASAGADGGFSSRTIHTLVSATELYSVEWTSATSEVGEVTMDYRLYLEMVARLTSDIGSRGGFDAYLSAEIYILDPATFDPSDPGAGIIWSDTDWLADSEPAAFPGYTESNNGSDDRKVTLSLQTNKKYWVLLDAWVHADLHSPAEVTAAHAGCTCTALADPTFSIPDGSDFKDLTDLEFREFHMGMDEPDTACNDDLDNDNDGFTDFVGGDPGCNGPYWNTESPQCQDGVNNDFGQDPNTGPALIDFDGGQSIWGECTGQPGGCPAEVSDPEGDGIANPDPECVGKPWSKQERKVCGLGAELALLLPPLMWFYRRRSLAV